MPRRRDPILEPRSVDRITALLKGEVARIGRSGYRLPSERQLAERFGVGRGTIRSALARLEALGIVWAERGSGYQIGSGSSLDGFERLAEAIAAQTDTVHRWEIAADVLLLRRQLLGAALTRMSTLYVEDRQSFAARLGPLREAVEGRLGPAPVAQRESTLLCDLGRFSGSIVLGLTLRSVVKIILGMPELSAAMYENPEPVFSMWRDVTTWLASGKRAGIDRIFEKLEFCDLRILRTYRQKNPEGSRADH